MASLAVQEFCHAPGVARVSVSWGVWLSGGSGGVVRQANDVVAIPIVQTLSSVYLSNLRIRTGKRGLECCRCGVIFFKVDPQATTTKTDPAQIPAEPAQLNSLGLAARGFGIQPWFSLVCTVGVLLMILRTLVERLRAPETSSLVDQGVHKSVDVIQTPMDKARGVEGTLSEAAGRTVEQVQETTP